MKKKSQSRIGAVFGRIFRVREWADVDRTKSYTWYLVDGFKKLFIPQKHQEGESFTTAVKEFHLSEDDLKARQKALYRLALLMLTIGIVVFGYAVYCLIYGYFTATMLSLVVVMLALVLAFRYHFWYFQISKRKLGCSFSEWFQEGLRGIKR